MKKPSGDIHQSPPQRFRGPLPTRRCLFGQVPPDLQKLPDLQTQREMLRQRKLIFSIEFFYSKKKMSGLWFEEAIFVDDLMIGFVWRDFFVWSSGDMYIWYMCKNMFMYLNVWKCVIDSRYTHIFACSAHTLHCSYVYSSFHWYVLEFFQTFVTSFFF